MNCSHLMRPVSFTIPGKPHAKARPWATSVNGRAHVFTPKATVTYEATVRSAVYVALDGREPFSGPVQAVIRIRLQPPKSASKAGRQAMLDGRMKPTKRPDLDNVVKSIIDGCNGIAFRDDADVVRIVAEKVFHIDQGVDVTIIDASETLSI